MSSKTYFQQNCKNTKQSIIKRFPNATNIKLGHNNICKGYWFNLPHGNIKNLKVFRPLNETVNIN